MVWLWFRWNLDEISSDASKACGLEPNADRASIVRQKGHHVVNSLSQLDDSSLDVITMFHVLEQLTDPIVLLGHYASLTLSGRIIIEVPHARDALFTLYHCDAFKSFTFGVSI